MPDKKLKVLMCSEASFINSGFGVYAKEVLTRLYKSGKYEIAEFASYGFVNDPRDVGIPWRYYAMRSSPMIQDIRNTCLEEIISLVDGGSRRFCWIFVQTL